MAALDKVDRCDLAGRPAARRPRCRTRLDCRSRYITGTRVYVQSTGSGAMGVRAEDGKLLWTFDVEKRTAVIPTPIVRDDLVFFVAGYGRGGALLRPKFPARWAT